MGFLKNKKKYWYDRLNYIFKMHGSKHLQAETEHSEDLS